MFFNFLIHFRATQASDELLVQLMCDEKFERLKFLPGHAFTEENFGKEVLFFHPQRMVRLSGMIDQQEKLALGREWVPLIPTFLSVNSERSDVRVNGGGTERMTFFLDECIKRTPGTQNVFREGETCISVLLDAWDLVMNVCILIFSVFIFLLVQCVFFLENFLQF